MSRTATFRIRKSLPRGSRIKRLLAMQKGRIRIPVDFADRARAAVAPFDVRFDVVSDRPLLFRADVTGAEEAVVSAVGALLNLATCDD